MPPEKARMARAGDKCEWLIGMFVNRRIKLANYVVEYSRRKRKCRPPIAAIGRMADAIDRIFREKHSLVDVRGNFSPAKMFRERAAPHQHDAVTFRSLFCARRVVVFITTIVGNINYGAC